MLAHLTFTESDASPEPPSEEPKVAVLSYTPHALPVSVTTWTDSWAPAAIVPKSQCRDSLPGLPEIEQPVTAGLIDQSVPAESGRLSSTTTSWAALPPEFLTVIVKPIWSPALTDASSACFSIVVDGGSQPMASNRSFTNAEKSASKWEPPPMRSMTSVAHWLSPADENGRLVSPGSPAVLR